MSSNDYEIVWPGPEPKIKSKYNYYYRHILHFSLICLLPMRYIHKHRSGLLDKLLKKQQMKHHLLEITARLLIGHCLGLYAT